MGVTKRHWVVLHLGGIIDYRAWQAVSMASIWVPTVAFGALQLARAVVVWCGRIRYERVRAAAAASILQSMLPGDLVQDVRADGTSFRMENLSHCGTVDADDAGQPPEAGRC